VIVSSAPGIMGAVAAAVTGTGGYGHFTDAAGIAHAIAVHSGRSPGR